MPIATIMTYAQPLRPARASPTPLTQAPTSQFRLERAESLATRPTNRATDMSKFRLFAPSLPDV